MKRLLTEIVRFFARKNYIHIPKWNWLKNLIKSILIIGKVRGRGRNWNSIHADNINPRQFYFDGSVPMKYAGYLYLPLK